MMEWQPIETSPRDGSAVLVGYGGENYMDVAFWDDWTLHWTIDGDSEVDPTHWMTLPEPPKCK